MLQAAVAEEDIPTFNRWRIFIFIDINKKKLVRIYILALETCVFSIRSVGSDFKAG